MPDALDTIFSQAVAIDDAAARAAHLDRACGGDPALRRQVEKLVAAHFRAGADFLERPAGGATAAYDAAGPTAGFVVVPVAGDTPSAQVGPYKLLEVIGEGGMGTVWLADQLEPVRRRVALKVIKAGMDSRAVLARFEAERQALALMDHPNIAKVLDAGATPDGRPYFAMELVKGVPITRYCDDNRLSPEARLRLFSDVCGAVQHAHQKGVIHRDLKPSNVLVGLYDGTPVVKVIDFGVAKAAGRPLTDRTLFTGFGAVVGTPEYMSPEQATLDNVDVDTRSDVYSLGVLLYELLTGTTPVTRERVREAALLEVLRVVREEDAPRPSTRISSADARATIAAVRGTEPGRLAKLLRGELDWVALRALEKDRGRRYESAAALADDVRRFLADEPVRAHPPSALYRVRKFARRQRGVVAAVALVAASLVAGTAVSAWQAVQADAARRLAEDHERDEARARAEAEGHRKRAEANFQKAMEAVDRFLTRVGDESLREVPQLEPVRRMVLEDALEFSRGFLAEQRDDPALRRQTARALSRVAGMCHQLGRKEESKAHYEEAIAALRDLHAARPDDLAVAVDLAIAYAEIGFLRFDHSAECERYFAAAIALLDAVAAGRPADLAVNGARVRTLLANCHRARGSQLARLRRQDEAETAIMTAIALSREDPGWWGVDVLASSYDSLAELNNHRHRRAESVAAMERCVAARDEVARLRPGGFHQYQLAFGYWCYGNSLSYAGRLADADAAYRRAADVVEPLAANFPSTPSFSKLLQDARRSRVTTLTGLGKRDDAVRAADALRPRTADEYVARAASYRDLGSREKAVADLTEAFRLDPKLVSAFVVRGDLYLQGGDDRAALADFTRAVESGPAAQRWRAHERRGYVRDRLGDLAGARDDFTRAIELHTEPGNWFVYKRRASIHFRLGNFPAALADVTRAVDLKPDDATNVTWIGPDRIAACPDAAFRQGVIDQATRAVALTDGRPEAHDARARLYEAMGEAAKASADRVAAIVGLKRRADEQGKSAASGRPETLRQLSGVQALLGQNYLSERRYVEAEGVLRECLAAREEVMPDDWLRFNAQSLLGGALLGQGKHAEAEPLLLAGYEGMKAREGTIPAGNPRLAEAVERVVALYDATGRPREADAWRARRPLPVAPPPRPRP